MSRNIFTVVFCTVVFVAVVVALAADSKADGLIPRPNKVVVVFEENRS